MALSSTYVSGLKPKDMRYFSKRERGLCVRVEPTGLKSWYLIYDIDHKRTRYMIGHVSEEQGLAWAREEVEPMRTLLSRGICPKRHSEDQRKQIELERLQQVTFSKLLDAFTNKELPNRKIKTAHEKIRILTVHFLSVWEDIEVGSITRAMVDEVLDSIKAPSAR